MKRMTQHDAPWVRVTLDVLIEPADEHRLAQAIRSSVLSCAPGPGFTHSQPVWTDATAGADLVRQWEIEQRVPSGARRVREFTMDVHGAGVAALVEQLNWAAIDTVCPTAREEHRRLDSGEEITFVADEFPWSSATRVIDEEADDRPER